MTDFPHCHWQIIDDRRGTCVFAGYFRMGDAVRDGLSMIETGGWVGSITIEPWFETREREFQFWAEWWAMQDCTP
jgi:hypothetical protein